MLSAMREISTGLRSPENTRINVNPPTLPKNMRNIIMICDAAESDPVIPQDSPTVPIAETTSNTMSCEVKPESASIAHMSMEQIITAAMYTKNTVPACGRASSSKRRLNMCASLLRRAVRIFYF